MNPDIQLLLAEFQKLASAQVLTQKKIDEQTDLLERRFTAADEVLDMRFHEADAAVEQRIIDSKLRQDARLSSIEKTASDLTSWRHEHEGIVDDLRLCIVKSEQHAASASAGYKAARPNGHGIDPHHRENEFGVVTTYTHSPVTGTDNSSANPPKFHGTAYDLVLSRNRPPETHRNLTSKLPKMSFPTFDGTDLKLWITCAEDYFDMYSVDPSVWIQCSRMQFLGPAKRWIQSVTGKLKTMTWSKFCQALHSRFDHDQHEYLLRKMNRIRQTSSVQDYVDRFSELVDQLTAYDSSTNALHYITRFLDGLHLDICTVILVQRPDSLDTTYTLALLQEEATESSWKREFKSWHQKAGYSLPPRQDSLQVGAVDKPLLTHKPLDKKLTDLKAYRRARGLCDHYGEKWNRDHKCAQQVIGRVGAVAYKLKLPKDSTIHPVFHVSQLKTAIPTSHSVADLPHNLDGLQIPLKILQRRIHTTDHNVVPQVLVQWSNLLPSLATWEDTEALRQRFPCAPVWGQADLHLGEDVSVTRMSNLSQPPIRRATELLNALRVRRTRLNQDQEKRVVSDAPTCGSVGMSGRE
ncbi:uncharacterized protein [Miscanthus floridulus]|uniref:uncharacterized protein n=1 Tax=Miscanthus floridulus TaxID=154761 RepID=UPI0034586A99